MGIHRTKAEPTPEEGPPCKSGSLRKVVQRMKAGVAGKMTVDEIAKWEKENPPAESFLLNGKSPKDLIEQKEEE